MKRSRAGVVLIVEDDDDTREVFVAMLTDAGLRCVATGAPDEAIRHAASVHFDVVVMDLGLPRLADGLALASRLLGLADAPPLIAVTGHRLDAESARLFQAQFKKPNLDNLAETVCRIIAERSGR